MVSGEPPFQIICENLTSLLAARCTFRDVSRCVRHARVIKVHLLNLLVSKVNS